MKLTTRRKVDTRRKGPHHPTSLYVVAADDFDAMGLYAVRTYQEVECPSLKWFRDRALLNHFLIAQHSVDGIRIIVRLR